MNNEEIIQLNNIVVEIKKKHPKIMGKWTYVKETINCPKCGKKILYVMSSYNGHTMGRCETEGCFHWIE